MQGQPPSVEDGALLSAPLGICRQGATQPLSV